MIKLLEFLVVTIVGALVLGFVLLNMMLGCEDWSKDNCITPKQIWQEIFVNVD